MRIFVVLEEGLDDHSIRQALPSEAPVRYASLSEAAERGNALMDESPIDLVVLGCSAYSERALRVIETASTQRPDCPVVVFHQGSPNGFMQLAFEAGADDLISMPLDPAQIAFALEKVVARRRGGAGSAPSFASMITVLGPKGGTGKTLTVCNLGVALALEGKRPVLVDLDLQFGDVGLALGLNPERTLYDLAVSGGSMDSDKVEGFLVEHASGAKALLAPVRPDQAAAVGIPFLQSVFEILRASYDFVIVDTPPSFSPEVIASIDSASDLCMVGMLDSLSLKDTKIGFETLAEMGYGPGEITLILNRADSIVGITAADVEQLLGRRPDILVPSDRAIPRAVTEGRSIVEAAPRSGAARAFTALAERYIHGGVVQTTLSVKSEQRGRRGLRRALLGKGK
jgi:pilus assembly protein CpaE